MGKDGPKGSAPDGKPTATTASRGLGSGAGKSGAVTHAVSDSYALQFPNALPHKSVIWCCNRGVWKQASIVHCKKSNPSTADASHPFDYYVHWEGYDRRLDCWVSRSDIRTFDQGLPESEPCEESPPDQDDRDHAGMDEDYLREHEENTKLKTIGNIFMGRYLVEAWYFSPYPKEFQNLGTLYICEFCLNFFREKWELNFHIPRCSCRCPPGDEIYRDDRVAMFEVDGAVARIYSENLCFLSKVFLDHKTLKHPVSLFLFYILAEHDEAGYHFVGYFSKEKYSRNNVACILTLPQYQRKGYGKFLIAFSYHLSFKECKKGTPERPLSDLGRASYMSWWAHMLLPLIAQFHSQKKEVSCQELSDLTSIDPADIELCLEDIGVLRQFRGYDILWLPEELLQSCLQEAGRAPPYIDRNKINWESYDACMMPWEMRDSGAN